MTQIATAERGHYEIDYGNGWRRASSEHIWLTFGAYYDNDENPLSQLRAGSVIRKRGNNYRYVEDKP